MLPFMHPCMHAYTLTHSLTHSLTPSLSHEHHARALSLSHTLIHTRTRTHTHTLQEQLMDLKPPVKQTAERDTSLSADRDRSFLSPYDPQVFLLNVCACVSLYVCVHVCLSMSVLCCVDVVHTHTMTRMDKTLSVAGLIHVCPVPDLIQIRYMCVWSRPCWHRSTLE
jgi:hypothetical protein